MKHVSTVIGTVCLAFVLLWAGLAVCLIPDVTKTLCEQTCGYGANTIFTTEQLTRLGVAIRDFSFDNPDETVLLDVVLQINKEQNTPYGSLSQKQLQQTASDQYTLDTQAISHLKDVYEVVSNARLALVCAVIGLIVCLVYLGRNYGKTNVRKIFYVAPIALLLCLVVMGLFAAYNFDEFFTIFHQLFFSGDTWLFSYKSLLITALPESFWIGMALIWFVSSTIACILSLIIAKILKGRRNRNDR